MRQREFVALLYARLFAYTALGSTARHPGSLPFIIALTAVAILTVVLAVISRTQRRDAVKREANTEMSIPAEP